MGGHIDVAFVATRVSNQTKLSKEMLGGEWNEYGFPLMTQSIANRVSYAQSLSDGVSVYETADQSAKLEIDPTHSTMRQFLTSVSYTHLTLPTSDLV